LFISRDERVVRLTALNLGFYNNNDVVSLDDELLSYGSDP